MRAALLALALVLPSAGPVQASRAFTLISLVGETLPGGGETLHFTGLGIEADGDVVLGSRAPGIIPTTHTVVRWSAGTFTKIAATGDPIPGKAAGWLDVSPGGVNAAGDVLLVGRPDVYGDTLLAHVDAAGSGSFLAAQGDVPAPGPWGFEHLWQYSRPRGGEVAVYASTLNGPAGVFIVRSGTDSTVVLEGDPKPGGGLFEYLGAPDRNASGDVLVPDPDGLYRWSSGVFTAVVENGDLAPGGSSYLQIYGGSIDDSGRIVFQAYFDPAATDRGIYQHDGSDVTAIVRTGDPAPGGGTFGIQWSPRSNSRGDVFFKANLDDGRKGLFVAVSGEIYLVAIVGDVAPGTGGGTFDDFGFADLNTSRQVVFEADVTGGSASGGVFLAERPPTGAPAVSPGGLVVLATFVSFVGASALRASSGRRRGLVHRKKRSRIRVHRKNKPRIRYPLA